MSNSLDPDQARRFVGPDLGPNCLPRLSADDTGRQRVNEYRDIHILICMDFPEFYLTTQHAFLFLLVIFYPI